MTVKEYLNGRTITAIEIHDQLVFNIFIGDELIGLDINISSVPSGTPLSYRTDFQIINDILTIDTISLDLNNNNVLGYE